VVDVAEVNGRIFLNNASLGLYPALLESRERAYERWGPVAAGGLLVGAAHALHL
jgi:diacylglycerol kinase family enzyme